MTRKERDASGNGQEGFTRRKIGTDIFGPVAVVVGPKDRYILI